MDIITVTLEDNGKQVERELDISIFMFNNCLYNPELQRSVLLDWIEERGNPQHSTNDKQADLKLVCWSIT